MKTEKISPEEYVSKMDGNVGKQSGSVYQTMLKEALQNPIKISFKDKKKIHNCYTCLCNHRKILMMQNEVDIMQRNGTIYIGNVKLREKS